MTPGGATLAVRLEEDHIRRMLGQQKGRVALLWLVAGSFVLAGIGTVWATWVYGLLFLAAGSAGVLMARRERWRGERAGKRPWLR